MTTLRWNVKGGRREILSMGHQFGADLRCDCGARWEQHQAQPQPCGSSHARNAFPAGSIASLCRRHGVKKVEISRQAGYSTRTVLLAFQEDSRIPECTRATVMAVAVGLLRDCGVEVDEVAA